ncbi:MAG: carbohydrate ABC transporter permease [Treponema sp.]|nr:carbohydrate ABC transporter permease [Treponema sp.]
MLKKTYGDKIVDALIYFFLCVIVIITLYPMYYVLISSISQASLLIRHTGFLALPQGFSVAAYVKVFQNPLLFTSYGNTIFYVVVGTLLNMALTLLGAYVLSRKDFYLRTVLTFVVIFTMYFSGGLIPFYLQVQNLGLMNTRWAIIFPTALSTFNLIIMRTGFSAVPDSLEESARIDGAGDFRILVQIMIPLAMPTVSVLILFYGVTRWNEWFNATIFIRQRLLFPLQVLLREILLMNSTSDMVADLGALDKDNISQTIKYATIIVAVVPVLLIYPFLQRYFVKGVMIGAVKG